MPKLETDCLLSLPAWGSALLGLLFLGVCSADGDDEHNQARRADVTCRSMCPDHPCMCAGLWCHGIGPILECALNANCA